MLGSQPLSILLQVLQCPLAEQAQAEHARAPALCPSPAAAFLYIEGTFYIHQPAGARGTCMHPAAGRNLGGPARALLGLPRLQGVSAQLSASACQSWVLAPALEGPAGE